ncbi:MAG: aspartate aminotransferase family protein [Gammaproteobacteria bacterium]|nr:aspartate aminotransferase family protein [Gammaproteobacteria bacterium]MDD9875413.1 aspartate aminotransferase family protein [Gammaproteobacteria bacterium]
MNAPLSNAALLAKDHRHLIHPLHHTAGHADGRIWARGEGSYLYDADGNRFIDGLSCLWNVSAGHGRRVLAEAAFEQMKELAFASSYAGGSNRPAIELAERLAAITYPGINNFYFTCGGGESTDSNIKLARYYWKAKGRPDKVKIIGRTWGYHGVTFGAMCATGISGYWPDFGPLIPGFSHIPSPDPYHYPVPADGSSQGALAADELEKEILKQGADTVAMFIAEPVQGAGGVIVAQPDYFKRIREICDRYEVLLVADEVITGFGRTGKMFGLEHYGVQPDLMQFAKSITSGALPLGGIGMSDEVAQTITSRSKPWMHAYTYSGHPTSCAVALATLDIIENEDLPGQAAAKGEVFLQKLHAELDPLPHVGNVRGLGLMAGVEIVADRSTKKWFDADFGLGAKLTKALINRGLYTRVRSEVICLAPPLTTEPSTLDEIVSIVRDAVIEVTGN